MFPPVNEIIHITCKVINSPLVLGPNVIESLPKQAGGSVIGEKSGNNLLNVNNCIAKIEGEIAINNIPNYIRGIGYLCNITSKNIKVLITYNQVLNLEYLNKIIELIVYINNNKILIKFK